MKTIRVLVVGGAGYIGSVTAAKLVEQGYQVSIFDNLSTGHMQAIPQTAAFYLGDLKDSDRINAVIAEVAPDIVFHFAALAEVGESMRNPTLYYRENVGNSINLFEACVANGVKKIIFSSTCTVYPATQTAITDESTLLPQNSYGETKLAVEKMLHWFQSAYGFRYAVLRYFNACGAYGNLGEDHTPESHLIPLVLQTALGRRSYIEIYGTDYDTDDGTCIRDYVHVADLADAHLLAVQYLDQHSNITCNLGSGSGYSVREVIDAVIQVTGNHFQVVESARRKGDPARLVGQSVTAQRELGWIPKRSKLTEIVSTAYEWMCQHPSGYTGGNGNI